MTNRTSTPDRDRLSREEPTPLAPPVLTLLVPDTAKLGSANFTLHVGGSVLKANDVILWNGAPLVTTYVSASELTAQVNMATVTAAGTVPISVRTAIMDISNVLMFTVAPAATLPEAPAPDGFVLVTDAWDHPMLVRSAEIIGIEEAIQTDDARGGLYAHTPSPAGAYRRITVKGGFQFYVAARSLDPMLRDLSA